MDYKNNILFFFIVPLQLIQPEGLLLHLNSLTKLDICPGLAKPTHNTDRKEAPVSIHYFPTHPFSACYNVFFFYFPSGPNLVFFCCCCCQVSCRVFPLAGWNKKIPRLNGGKKHFLCAFFFFFFFLFEEANFFPYR